MEIVKKLKEIEERLTRNDASKNIFQCENIEKSRIPMYLNKIPLGNGKYKYIYFDDKTNKTRELLPRIEYTKASVLHCNIKNAAIKGKQFLKDWNDDWQRNPKKAKIWALNNSPVKLLTTGKNKITLFHFDHKGGGQKRKPKDVYERALLLPYAKKMLEGKKLCLLNEVRKHSDRVEYELVGKARINGVDRVISVIISKMYGDKKVYIDTINKAISFPDMAFINDVYFTDPKILTNQVKLNLGISDSNNHLKESLSKNALQTSGKLQSLASENYSNRKPKHNLNIPYRDKMSSEKLKQLQKSLGLDDIQFQTYLFSKENHKNDTFAVVITDITENNKEKKVEQLQKSLNCVDRQQPFSVRHIKSDILSQRYDDITLVISNFNKDKIDKAVNTVSFALDVKPKSKHKGEQFFYKAQENLTDEIILECFEKVKKMYLFVLNYFALPDVRIVAKADLKYKGKIIYNPETGEPIKTNEWKSFIKALQSFIDKEFKLIGRKIALKGQVLGRMLQRLSKRYSFAKLKKVELKDLEVKDKKIDWISENTKNIKDVFGESIDRKTQAKIETANLSATQKIQQITDNEQNKIKNILIDGIKNKESKAKISQKLFDSCVGMNRDFQRIVDTELQNNTNSAYIHEEVYNAKEDERIYFKRSETIDDVTCKKCKKLKDTVAVFSPIPLDNENVKDEFAKYAIWDGKDGAEWKAPMGTMHPYCRGFWYRYYPIENS